jgi:hypothetical protein
MSTPERDNAARSASDLADSAADIENKIQAGLLEHALEDLRLAGIYLESTRQWVLEAVRDGRCPDGGTCHHQCASPRVCFRVTECGPLSGVYPGDRWPADVRQAARGE